MLVGDTANGGVVTRTAKTAWVEVAEVAHHGTTIVIATGFAIVDFRSGGIAEIIVGAIFITCIDLMTVDVGIEITMMLGVAMPQSCGRQA